jgi:putative ABC transport system permease protein
MSIARRNMMAGKARTAFSIAGVATATLLLSFVVGLYRGWNDDLVRYIRDTPADTWVVGRGADSFFTPSLVFNTTAVEVQQVKGVRQSSPLLGRPLRLRRGNESWDSYVIAFDPAGMGGPVAMREGKVVPATGEIVIDDVLARASGLKIGDEVVAGLRHLTVAGISVGGNLVLAQLSFITMEDGRDIVGLGAVNFLLLRTEPGQAQSVMQEINTTIPGVEAFSAQTFANNTQEVLKKSILPILFVIVLMALLVGTVVVGLTVYTAAVEKEREFGILKALGVPPSGLLRVIFEQSLVCGAFGVITGIIATLGVSWLAGIAFPQVVTLFRWQDILGVALVAAAMSVIGGLVPIHRIMRADALAVFKA